jgi:hypothetical protein
VNEKEGSLIDKVLEVAAKFFLLFGQKAKSIREGDKELFVQLEKTLSEINEFTELVSFETELDETKQTLREVLGQINPYEKFVERCRHGSGGK